MSVIQLVSYFILITNYAFATADSVFSTNITLFKITDVKGGPIELHRPDILFNTCPFPTWALRKFGTEYCGEGGG
jgi:hypothetical protein